MSDEIGSTGHAAVGYVMGTRTDDGRRPEYVRLTYRRNGIERQAIVQRVANTHQVEYDDSDTVRFVRPRGGFLHADAVLDAEPNEGPNL